LNFCPCRTTVGRQFLAGKRKQVPKTGIVQPERAVHAAGIRHAPAVERNVERASHAKYALTERQFAHAQRSRISLYTCNDTIDLLVANSDAGQCDLALNMSVVHGSRNRSVEDSGTAGIQLQRQFRRRFLRRQSERGQKVVKVLRFKANLQPLAERPVELHRTGGQREP
jgi:hypothetical protein